MKIEDASERSVIVYWDNPPDSTSIVRLKTFTQRIKGALQEHLIDVIPSYASILVIFNPMTTDHATVRRTLLSLADHPSPIDQSRWQSRLVRLPVYYDEQTGPDLARIADHHQIDIEDVIRQHSMAIYHVFAIGFAPGFAYLGEVDEGIAMPRHPTPRPAVVAGSVGIADRQTAVYPATSPGGWNIIGRCPTVLFDPEADPPMPFVVGDRVQFMRITQEEFFYLGGVL